MRNSKCSARLVAALAAAAVIGGTGCALFSQVHAKRSSPNAAKQLTAADRQATLEVEAALQRYSAVVLAMDLDAIAASYTADGELADAGEPVHRGPADIRNFMSAFKDVRLEANDHVTESIFILGSTAKQNGTYRQRATVAGETVDVRGRFTADWVRQSDGRWLLRRMTTEPAP